MASKLYALTIQHRMGGMSFGKIEWEVAGRDVPRNTKYWSSYPRKLYRYANGAPMNLKRNREMIDVIEARLPGTRRILEHPLWLILENPEASLEELEHYLSLLDLALLSKVLRTDKSAGNRVWKIWKKTSQFYRIAMHNNLDALAALLIITRECEIRRRAHPYIEAKWAVSFLMSRLSVFRPFMWVADEIYHVVYNDFLGKNIPLPPELAHEFADYFPRLFEPPRQFPTIYREMDFNSGLVWHAECLGLVKKNDEQDQLMFLFWVLHFFNRVTIDKQLKDLKQVPASINQLPEPLRDVMIKFRGDRRRQLPSSPLFR